jgi:hypothetical protein
MLESERKLIQDSFSSVKIYLVHPQDLRDEIEAIQKESEDLTSFMKKLRETAPPDEETTRKTDRSIFLNKLRRKIVSPIK